MLLVVLVINHHLTSPVAKATPTIMVITKTSRNLRRMTKKSIRRIMIILEWRISVLTLTWA